MSAKGGMMLGGGGGGMGGGDSLYMYDDQKVEAVRAQKLWMSDPKYFKRVKISPSATIKMMMHGHSGVEKGIKKSGKPLEVMGMLMGRPCTEDPQCLIISDVQPLPCEGFETKVIADSEEVQNYQIELAETNELTRKELSCGWYHTHPFDVDVMSNCYLSATDISTQLLWQRSEDPQGNPQLAIVIDPLRSLAKGRPELMAFRVYPPDFNPPLNETPDGTFVADDRSRVAQWGNCWSRYYKLQVSYYMSTLAQNTLGSLKSNFFWQTSLASTPMLEPEHQQGVAERIGKVVEKLEATNGSYAQSFRGMGGEDTSAPLDVAGGGGGGGSRSEGLAKTAQSGCELAVEQCQGCASQLMKMRLFGSALNKMAASSKKKKESGGGGGGAGGGGGGAEQPVAAAASEEVLVEGGTEPMATE